MGYTSAGAAHVCLRAGTARLQALVGALNAMDFDVPDDLIAANAVTGEEATRDLPAQDVAFINQLIEIVNDPQVRTHHAAFLFPCVPVLHQCICAGCKETAKAGDARVVRGSPWRCCSGVCR